MNLSFQSPAIHKVALWGCSKKMCVVLLLIPSCSVTVLDFRWRDCEVRCAARTEGLITQHTKFVYFTLFFF